MKKILGLIGILVVLVLVFAGFTPRIPGVKECTTFHPHDADFGGPEGVNRVLNWLIEKGQFNAWSGTSGRTVVQFSYNGLTGFMAYGQGNPTMFIATRGIDYIREQTSGLKKITSEKGLNAVKQGIGTCRASYAQGVVSIPAQEPVSIPAPSPATSSSAALLAGVIGAAILIGGSKLAFARR